MLNASRCRLQAERYARLAEAALDVNAQRLYRRLEFLWREMTPVADDYDRWADDHSKRRLYEMIDVAAEVSRKASVS